MPGAASKDAALFLLRFFSEHYYDFFLRRNIPVMKFSTSGTFLLLIGDLIKLYHYKKIMSPFTIFIY